MVAGVAGGLSERLGIDALVLRLAFVALAFAAGAGLVLYLLLWLVAGDRTEPAEHVRPRSTSALLQHGFAYDNASRLQRVTDYTTANPYAVGYTYLANSPLLSQIGFTNNGAWRMTTSKSYDFLNRLTSISSVGSGSASLPSFS